MGKGLLTIIGMTQAAVSSKVHPSMGDGSQKLEGILKLNAPQTGQRVSFS